jgi:hypothetical protein
MLFEGVNYDNSSSLLIMDNDEGSLTVDNEEIIFKGESSYDHIGGPNDVFMIKFDDNQYNLSRNALYESLEELNLLAEISVTDLTTDQKDCFRTVVNALKILKNSDELYGIIMLDINKIFNEIKVVKPGTVAAYFIGCKNSEESGIFSDNLGCDPKCTSSLNDSDSSLVCEDTVLIYSNGEFTSLNDSNSSNCYIYIGHDEDIDFSRKNVKELKNAGISTVVLVYGNSDGSYKEITNPLPLTQLSVHDNHNNTASENDTKTGTNKTGIAVGLGFATLALIILILILWRNRRNL